MPQQEDIAPHVEELARALDDDVPKEKIRAELERWLDHGVPLHQAKRDLLTSLGGQRKTKKNAKAISASDGSIDLTARVATVEEREVTARGRETTIWEGDLADETGRVAYTAWRDLDLEPGQVLKISDAYVRTWQGEPQVNIGDNTEVEVLDDSEVPPLEDLPEARPEAEAQAVTGGSREMAIGDLEPGMSSVRVTGRILGVDDRTVQVQGEPKTIWEGQIADASGKVAYTSWHDHGLEPGQAVTIDDAYVRTFRGAVQLNFGEKSEVATADDADVPEAEALEDSQALTTGGEQHKVKALQPGMNTVTTVGRILTVNERDVEVKGKPRTLWEGELADETGRVSYTCWDDHGLEEGQVVKIENAYVRSFRGLASLNFGEHANVSTLDDDRLPPISELKKNKPYTVAELEASGGAIGVKVDAVVLEVREGSGLILRCPECRRVLQDRECRLHGRVEGLPDLRIKAVIDDGTGAVTAFFNRNLTEEILGKDLDACQELVQETYDREIVRETIQEEILLERVIVNGNATHDDYGTTLMVDSIDRKELDDVEGRAEALLDRVHVLTEEVVA